jgi:hypothetical protein
MVGGFMVATNALAVYQRIANPVDGIREMGKMICGSGLFGTTNPRQGDIIAWECMTRGATPLELAESYHMIQGKLSMKADRMVAGFNQGGGKHRIICRTPDCASVEMTFDGNTQVFTLTWEECSKEPFVYRGKEKEVVPLLLDPKKHSKLVLKDKYSTPRARMQMLWARVISDAVRAMMPNANYGKYTPEEISDQLDEERENAKHATKVNGSGTVAGSDISQGEVIDGDFTVVDGDEDAEATSEPADVATSVDEPTLADEPVAKVVKAEEFCTAAQSQQINDLFAAVGMKAEQIAAALKKRGANNNRSLKFEAAAELIATLEGAKAKKLAKAAADAAAEQAAAEQAAAVEQEAVDGAVGESRQREGSAFNLAGPATKEQCDEAKKSLKELNQVDPGMFNRWLAHMKSKGLQIADLSAADCQELIVGVQKKTLDRFFELSLEKWVAKSEANSDAPFEADSTEEPTSKN